MAGARAVVETEVLGERRRLRISLQAVDRIETATDTPFPRIAETMGDEREVRFGHLMHLFVELCRAGGTPLSPEEQADLMPTDLPEILEAVREALVEAGIIEVVEEPVEAGSEAAADEGEGDGKKKDPTPSRGGSGSE